MYSRPGRRLDDCDLLDDVRRLGGASDQLSDSLRQNQTIYGEQEREALVVHVIDRLSTAGDPSTIYSCMTDIA